MTKALAAVAVLLGVVVATPLFAHTEYLPLRDRIDSADLIAVVRVIAINRAYPVETADLQVEESLAGQLDGLRVTVTYPIDAVCPAPPRFAEQERVLAFLARAEGDKWRVVGLGQGVIKLSDPQLRTNLSMLIKSRRSVTKGWTGSARERATRDAEWLVSRLEGQAFEWDALKDLLARVSSTANSAGNVALTPGHRARLVAYLEGCDELDGYRLELVERLCSGVLNEG